MKKFITNNPEFILTAIIALVICFCCKTAKSQQRQYQPRETTPTGVFTYAAAGTTAGFFNGEWFVGYRQHKTSISLGFNVIPNNTQPVLFQLRAGYNFLKHFHVHASAVRVNYSLDDKTRNYNTYNAGLQYHFSFFDRGTIFTGINYTPGFTSLLIGMSYNLMHKPNEQ